MEFQSGEINELSVEDYSSTDLFYETDAIANIKIDLDPPNERYDESVSLGTWSSISTVDAFFSRFNHSNAYKDGNIKLRLGNYVTIQDGTYNAVWEIAGFDTEHNQIAADGTTFDNGYGICMIPKTQATDATWNTDSILDGAYNSSTMHTSHLPGIVTKLQRVLGSHIVQRNVLLSNSVDRNGYSNAYTWTTAYATLMSIGQMTGTFTESENKYDDGEANYKLPIFNSKDFKTDSNFWSRGVCGGGDSYYAWSVYSDGSISDGDVSGTYGVRPLIYLR